EGDEPENDLRVRRGSDRSDCEARGRGEGAGRARCLRPRAGPGRELLRRVPPAPAEVAGSAREAGDRRARRPTSGVIRASAPGPRAPADAPRPRRSVAAPQAFVTPA